MNLMIVTFVFVMFLNELRNVMLLQESEKVNISKDVEQQMKFLLKQKWFPMTNK